MHLSHSCMGKSSRNLIYECDTLKPKSFMDLSIHRYVRRGGDGVNAGLLNEGIDGISYLP